jgi:hypothetical protein
VDTGDTWGSITMFFSIETGNAALLAHPRHGRQLFTELLDNCCHNLISSLDFLFIDDAYIKLNYVEIPFSSKNVGGY